MADKHAEPDYKTAFMFEINRHGARGPLQEKVDGKSVIEGFKVGVEQLTQQGMRQRYLLGRHNRKLGSELEGRDYCICNRE